MKKTVLYDVHVALGAKMAPFGGYLMPIQYEGIIKEHNATREHSTIFDTCHMGEFFIKGPTAVEDLEKIVSCKVATIKTGQCRYGLICNENGGVIDDQILYRFSESTFFMVVNAGTEPNDFAWIKEHISSNTELENVSEQTAKMDIQGPDSPKIMTKLLESPIDQLKYYQFMHNRYKGKEVLVSRTGYTGEIGFEIYCTPDLAAQFWNECCSLGCIPAGLGARDTLRLEMGMPLYGHELDTTMNAAESGFSKSIATDKEFIGSKVVCDPSKAKRKLIGIELEGRRAARNGDTIVNENGVKVGLITSGSFTPSVCKALALGYVDNALASKGTKLHIQTERNQLEAIVVELPFYKKATGRADINQFL